MSRILISQPPPPTGWQDDGTIVRLINVLDDVGIGTTTPGAKLEIRGDQDEIQLLIRANAVQSNANPLLKLVNSAGVELLRVHSDGITNLFVGREAGLSNSTGTYNTFLGSGAGRANTTGLNNVALGAEALNSATVDVNDIAIGYRALKALVSSSGRHIAIGSEALLSLTGGAPSQRNIAIGDQALKSSLAGDRNIAIGALSLFNSTGNYNVALGSDALWTLSTGSWNVALGQQALSNGITTGNNNVAIGGRAGEQAPGSSNVFLGYAAGFNELGSNKLYIANSGINPPLVYGDFSTKRLGLGTTGPASKVDIAGTADENQLRVRANAVQSNTNPLIMLADSAGLEILRLHTDNALNAFLGDHAGASIDSSGADPAGRYNSFLGSNAGRNCTTGYYNTFVGESCGYNITTGFRSVAVGYRCLYTSTNSDRNIAIGDLCLYFLPIGGGAQNVAIGSQSLYSLTSGGDNVGLGRATLLDLLTGNANMGIGKDSLRGWQSASFNVAIGYRAGYPNAVVAGPVVNNTDIGSYAGLNNNSGDNNVRIGFEAGTRAASGAGGSGNVFLGYQAGKGITASNQLYIANSSVSPPLIFGDFATGLLGLGTITPAEKLDVVGAIKLGTTANLNAGTIRWTGVDFEGYNGAVWQSLTAAGAPGGVNTQVQFNDGGAFGGDAGLVYDKVLDALTLVGLFTASRLNTTGSVDAVQLSIKANAAQSNPLVQLLTSAGAELLRLHANANSTIFLGYQAGNTNTAGGDNIFIGYQAGKNATGTVLRSVGIGSQALTATISNSEDNTAVGYQALLVMKDTNGNSAFGAYALYNLNDGPRNTAIGFETLRALDGGNSNVALGYQASRGLQGGNYNVALGYQAGYTAGAGGLSNNVFLGSQAGYSNAGSRNIFIGNQAGYNEAGSDRLYIENSNSANPLIYGNFSTRRLGINTGSPNSRLHVAGAIATALVSKAADYLATESDSIVLVDATAGNVNITLPTAAGITGREYTVKRIDSIVLNSVSVTPNGAETIDGATPYSLAAQWKYVRIASDGTNWMVVSNN
jgi:hypothetical protein